MVIGVESNIMADKNKEQDQFFCTSNKELSEPNVLLIAINYAL